MELQNEKPLSERTMTLFTAAGVGHRDRNNWRYCATLVYWIVAIVEKFHFLYIYFAKDLVLRFVNANFV